jgi:hypothetical protein
MNQKRAIFGIQVQSSIVKLLEQVEKLYGKKIREERSNVLPGQSGAGHVTFGGAYVAGEGTPVIQINDAVRPTEAIIVHEAIHLKKYAEGYPDIWFDARQGGFTAEHQNFLGFVLAHIYDSIQHYMFFPEMRKMGLDPESEVRQSLESLLNNGDFNYSVIPSGISPQEVRAITFFKVMMNISNDTLLRRTRAWYKSKHWDDSLEVGDKLAEIVTNTRPSTRDHLIDVFVNCLQTLRGDHWKFKFREWKQQLRGDHIHWYAVIDVLPSAVIKN